ncbi:MAG: hypothetical protein AAGF36_05460 [Pseudomonadota bacterium]
MSRIKILLAAATVTVASQGLASDKDTIAYAFAACAGRFSAEMEHAWLMNDPATDSIAQERSAFVHLTDAALPPGQGRAILHHRIEVKLAHAALLQQASFATHPGRARKAHRTADTHLATCRRLLLGS